jgi:hypothetical protein
LIAGSFVWILAWADNFSFYERQNFGPRSWSLSGIVKTRWKNGLKSGKHFPGLWSNSWV